MDSPRNKSPKQGLDVVAVADSVLLIYLEPARPKVNNFHFLHNETMSPDKTLQMTETLLMRTSAPP